MGRDLETSAATGPTAPLPALLQTKLDGMKRAGVTMNFAAVGDPAKPDGWISWLGDDINSLDAWDSEGNIEAYLVKNADGTYKFDRDAAMGDRIVTADQERAAREQEEREAAEERARVRAQLMGGMDAMQNNPAPPATRPTENVTVNLDYGPVVQTYPSRQAEITKGELAPAETTGTLAASLTDQQFVHVLYRSILGREAEEGGYNYWTDMLGQKLQTRRQVLEAFLQSPEAKDKNYNDQDFLTNLYAAVYGRTPDAPGYANFSMMLEDGAKDREEIAAMFLTSPELAQHGYSLSAV